MDTNTASLSRTGNVVTLTLVAEDEQKAVKLEAELAPMLLALAGTVAGIGVGRL